MRCIKGAKCQIGRDSFFYRKITEKITVWPGPFKSHRHPVKNGRLVLPPPPSRDWYLLFGKHYALSSFVKSEMSNPYAFKLGLFTDFFRQVKLDFYVFRAQTKPML